MSTDKPEKISIVQLSICIRISELPNLFCLKYNISFLKSDADFAIEIVCRSLVLQANDTLLFLRKCIICFSKIQNFENLVFLFPRLFAAMNR